MTAGPRVSIVLIVRDGEAFLPEALESVRHQRFDDWELVAVDDGSTDATAAILERYAGILGPRMRVVRHPGGVNRGMSASRNLGIRESRGELVTFLDHDDILLPGKLAAHVAAFEANPEAVVVIGPNLRWSSWAGPDREDETQDLGVPTGTTLPPPGPLPAFLSRSRAAPLGITVRREVLEAVGGFEDAFTGMYEDQVLQAKLYTRHPVHVLGEVHHWYRQHPDSCVRRTFGAGTQLLARRRFLLWLRVYLHAGGIHDAVLHAVIGRELRQTRLARWHWMRRQVHLGLARTARALGLR